MPGLDMRFDHHVLVEGRSGDDVWLTERLDTRMAAPAPGVPAFGFHEAFTFHASAAELADRARTHVRSAVQEFNVLSWRPWMAMGDRTGRLCSGTSKPSSNSEGSVANFGQETSR